MFGQKNGTKRNSVNVCLCVDGTDINTAIHIRPVRAGRLLNLPFPVKRETRQELVLDGSFVEQHERTMGTLSPLIDLDTTRLTDVPLPLKKLVRVRGGRIRCFDTNRVCKRLWGVLYPFQKEGVRRAIADHYGRVLLCDEMGLGKSVQALTISHYYRNEWPLLIICPSYLRYNWDNEIQKWYDAMDVQVVTKGRDVIRGDASIVIISYDLVPKMAKAHLCKRFKVIICDESHYIKNRKAARTKACLAVMRGCKRVVLLSGTPALSRPSELYTQLHAVVPETFSTFTPYATRYCDAKQGPFGWDTSGASNTSELQVINHLCMIRRLKKDVLTQLPPKRREDIVLPVVAGALEPLFEELAGIEKRIKREGVNLEFQRKQVVGRLFHETSNVKAGAVADYLTNVLPHITHKVIVFAFHRHMLDTIQGVCEKLNTDFIRIDGSTPQKNRMNIVNTFRTDVMKQVAILSIGACSTGLNFTMSAHVIFAELDWTPGVLLQAEDRTHRIGQRADSILIQYLIGKDTLDERVWSGLRHKFNTVNTILNDRNPSGFDTIYDDGPPPPKKARV
jgi:SWI/SNF-related matrix-associated actin-dependent regulator 1 of chromatin subfamily A